MSDLTSVRDVSVRFGRIEALADVSLDVLPGITILLGRNGAGKSTLCRVLAGVSPPASGWVERGGVRLRSRDEVRAHRSRTGWLPQNPSLPGSMTVREYLEYAAWLKAAQGHAVREWATRAATAVDAGELLRRRLRTLSGGQARRIAIAAALVGTPDLVVLDEPTVGLDPEQRAMFYELVKGLASDRAVVVSSHLIEDVAVLARRVAVLDRGRVLFAGELGAFVGSTGGSDPSERIRQAFLAMLGTSRADA